MYTTADLRRPGVARFPPVATDQKVGGSSPSERAQVSGCVLKSAGHASRHVQQRSTAATVACPGGVRRLRLHAWLPGELTLLFSSSPSSIGIANPRRLARTIAPMRRTHGRALGGRTGLRTIRSAHHDVERRPRWARSQSAEECASCSLPIRELVARIPAPCGDHGKN